MVRVRLFVLLGAVALAGCAREQVIRPQGGPGWKDVDANGVDLVQGARECKAQAKVSAAAATGIAKQEAVAEDFYDSCMRERGY